MWRALIALTALALGVDAAGATLVTKAFTVTATDFQAIGPDPVPYNVVSGLFTVTFDTATDIDQTTNNLTVGNFTLPDAVYPVTFAYDAQQDLLVFGNALTPRTSAASTSCTAFGTQPYFCFYILNASAAAPTILPFNYSTVDTVFLAATTTVASASVPEPAAWALMVVGFGALGISLRRTRADRERPLPI